MERTIKHTVRDCLIFILSCIGVVRVYRNSIKQRNGALVRVIAFHDVADRKWFEQVIDMLVKNFNVITPQEFHDKTFDAKEINILITFDDGYHSWIENALPVLEKYDLKAFFFINSGLLDAAEEGKADEYMEKQLLLSPKEPLTWDSAKELAAKGHAIGGHTALHDDLSRVNLPEAEEEIRTDRLRTECLLDIELSDFAYPFGTKAHYTADTIKAVKEAGYERAYTSVPGFFTDEAYEIPRTMLEKDQPLPSIKRWIKGGYDIFNMLKF